MEIGFDKLVDNVAQSKSTKELFHSLKPFRPTSNKAKSRITNLNRTLHNQHNQPIHNKQEVAKEWQRHVAT